MSADVRAARSVRSTVSLSPPLLRTRRALVGRPRRSSAGRSHRASPGTVTERRQLARQIRYVRSSPVSWLRTQFLTIAATCPTAHRLEKVMMWTCSKSRRRTGGPPLLTLATGFPPPRSSAAAGPRSAAPPWSPSTPPSRAPPASPAGHLPPLAWRHQLVAAASADRRAQFAAHHLGSAAAGGAAFAG